MKCVEFRQVTQIPSIQYRSQCVSPTNRQAKISIQFPKPVSGQAMRLKTAATTEQESDIELINHIRSVGLRTVDEYREWCARNGFSRKLTKHRKQRGRERQLAQAAVAQERVSQKKREKRNVDDIIRGICTGHLSEADLTLPHLQRLCQSLREGDTAQEPQIDRKVLLRLLTHLYDCRAKLFSDTVVIPDLGHAPGNTYIEALALVAAHVDSWHRPIDDWKPRTRSARRQFASLLRHLFAKFDDMPSFFDSVWFAGRSMEANETRAWYLHVARGQNLRHCNLPIPYTKKMSHHFMRSPHTATVPQALRWGQVLGLGGDRRLAEAILGTRLTDSFANDEFWSTVIRWFIAYPTLDRSQVGPIIDYLHHQRYVPQNVFVAGGHRDESPPPQPNLSMNGRTPNALLRKVNQWHRKLSLDNTHQVRGWQPTGIKEFELVEGMQPNGNLKIWTIRELLSSKALVAEGRTLKHCVATYASSCSQGNCSIWTMEVEGTDGHVKLLTIEVHNGSRTICQARGKANRQATEKERKILRRWAESAGLKVGSYV